MIVAGIDAGLQSTKVVILRGDEIVAQVVLAAGIDSTAATAERALSQAIEKAGISRDEVRLIAATGMERRHVVFAEEQPAEFLCLARGMSWRTPFVGTVMDIGAHKALAVQCKAAVPMKVAHSDRCATGTGTYLEMAAGLVGVGVSEMGELSLRSRNPVLVQNACAVFAESEIISLIHQRTRREDILMGVFKGLAVRLYPLLVGAGFRGGDVAMVGGVAKNVGVVKAMEEQIGRSVLVPDNPDIIGALGAALIAHKNLIACEKAVGGG